MWSIVSKPDESGTYTVEYTVSDDQGTQTYRSHTEWEMFPTSEVVKEVAASHHGVKQSAVIHHSTKKEL